MAAVRSFSRPMIWQHFLAAVSAVFVTALGAFFIYQDRKAPVEFISAQMVPENVRPGQDVVLLFKTNWSRVCGGVAIREIVGSDRVIRPYLSSLLRFPTTLGIQTSETRLRMPESLPPGEAVYRATIQFADCGYTSRIFHMPLTVNAPPIYFDVSASPAL